MTWENIEQSISHHRLRNEARMRLGNGRGGDVLYVTLPQDHLTTAGFQEGDMLALAIGTGRDTGALRLTKSPGGRMLKKLGRAKVFMTVLFVPPATWCGYSCESTIVEASAEPGAITIAIPWEFPGNDQGAPA